MSRPEEQQQQGADGGRGRRRRRGEDGQAEQSAESPAGLSAESPAEALAGSSDAEDLYRYAEPEYLRADPYGQPHSQPHWYQQQQPPYPPQAPEAPSQPQSYVQPSRYASDPEAAEQPNLDSSGFYQATRSVPEQGFGEDALWPAAQADAQEDAAQDADPTVARQGQIRAQAPQSQVPQSQAPQSQPPAAAARTGRATGLRSRLGARVGTDETNDDESFGSDEDVSDWLHFVESRGDQRRVRDRRRRVQLIACAVVLGLVGAGIGLWLFLSGGDNGGAAARATQTTILFQLRDAQSNAVGSVVLSADRGVVGGTANPLSRGAALLIPANLAVQVAGQDPQPFGGAMPRTPAAGADAISEILGVKVDGLWSIDVYTFASLIDSVGGITVDADTSVPGLDGKLAVLPGHDQFDGGQAVLYAAYHAKAEPPSKQLARFGQVVTALFAKVPTDETTAKTILNQLAAVPDPSLPNDRLAAILSALGTEQQGSRYTLQTLPLLADQPGTIDLKAASLIVAQLLGGAVHDRDTGGLTHVALYDASDITDSAASSALAVAKLMGGGYTVLGAGTRQSAPTTVVEIPNESARGLGTQVAETLGFTADAVKVVPFDGTLVDAVVVLGADWDGVGNLGLPTGPPTASASAAATLPGAGDVPSSSGSAPSSAPAGKTTRTARPSATPSHR